MGRKDQWVVGTRQMRTRKDKCKALAGMGRSWAGCERAMGGSQVGLGGSWRPVGRWQVGLPFMVCF